MSVRIVPITTEVEEEIFAEHHDGSAGDGHNIEDCNELGDLMDGLAIVGSSLSPARSPAAPSAPASALTPSTSGVVPDAPVDESNKSEPFPTQNQMEAKEARAMVLSCMDFRLLDDIVEFMNSEGYHNNYDQFILAGASLGYNQQSYPHWGALWTEHLGLALKLHKVKEIICIDHDRCGAYKLFHPEMKPEQEREYHVKNLTCFKCTMQKQYPDLKVSSFFMRLDGSCEKIEE